MGSVCMKLMQCSDLSEINGQMEEGDEVCLHWHLCICLYVKCSWCSGLTIDLLLIGGGSGVCLHWYLCIHLYVKHS